MGNTCAQSHGPRQLYMSPALYACLLLQDDDRDALIAMSQVGIILEFVVILQQAPRRLIRPRPVFAEDASANLTGFCQFLQAALHGDPDVAAGPGRSISVNDFEKADTSLPGEFAAGQFLTCAGQFLFQTLQCLVNRRPVGLEVYGLDGCLTAGALAVEPG